LSYYCLRNQLAVFPALGLYSKPAIYVTYKLVTKLPVELRNHITV